MIHLPTTLEELHAIRDATTSPNTTTAEADVEVAVVRAGGTDLQSRLRATNTEPTLVDLCGIGSLRQLDRTDDGWRIGSGITVAVAARETAEAYPALSITAAGLATPQVRAHGTVGGNLTQHTRCWYYRHPEISCWKSGGDSCPARDGQHLYGVVFDTAACVHPHPSSIAMALLTYDASITLTDGSSLTVAALLGDGSNPTRDHLLPDGAVVASIDLPAPWTDERAAYFRSISRFEAEWPLVECVVRARFDGDQIIECGLGLGGVATVPLRMVTAEASLTGETLTDDVIERVASACTDGANPLPQTGYKVDLVRATVQDTLNQIRSCR